MLAACIVAGVDYVDVCDDRRATEVRLGLHEAAQAAGITALIDTGTFPGIDNVLAADALARLPQADDVRLYFVCAGSGNGGFGVLETTFIAVSNLMHNSSTGRGSPRHHFGPARWSTLARPMGRRPVYNFEVPELSSLARTFPQLQRCTSKFGTIPELWNWATAGVARLPASVRRNPDFIHDAITFTLPWVHRLDRLTGGAIAIRVKVSTVLAVSSV